jgi:AcrR family transcriptional regulator
MVTRTDRRERKKAATRELILRTGMKLFARYGIDAVTVDQIADAADVGKGTLYNYFPTKEAIVVAFLADADQRIQRRLLPLEAARRPLVDTLTEFIAMQWRTKRRHHQFVRMFFAQMFLNTDTFLPYMTEVNGLLSANIRSLLQALRDRGAFRADVNIDELTTVLGHLQFGLTALWAIEGPPFKGTELMLRRELTLFCGGIEARKR